MNLLIQNSQMTVTASEAFPDETPSSIQTLAEVLTMLLAHLPFCLLWRNLWESS